MPDASDFLGEGATTTDKGVISDYPASLGESAMGGIERQFDTNPLAVGARMLRAFDEDFRARFMGESEKLVDQKTAQAEIASRGLDIKVPMGGMTRYELDTLQYLKQREIRQNTVAARADGALGVAAGFAGALAGSFTDPINVASNFIPFVSEYRYARWLAQAGTSTLGRAAVRAGAGAIEGAAGAAILEPLVYAGATSLQLDYDSTDSFLNVTLGGVMGGGLHTIGGAVYDARVARALRGLDQGIVGNTGIRDAIAALPEIQKRELFQAAVAAAERGETFNAENFIDLWHGSPHTFDKFDNSKIGTGEGAQAYGKGTYLAERVVVGRHYADNLGARDFADDTGLLFFDRAQALRDEADVLYAEGDIAGSDDLLREADAIVKRMSDEVGGFGNLYKVRVNAKLEDFVKWDLPLSEQPAAARDVLLRYLGKDDDPNGMTAGNVIRRNLGGSLEDDLQNAGIKGIRYLDGSSRSAGEGTYNYVVFDDKDIEIVSRNGEPIAKPQSPPRDLGGLIKQSRADRTQEAFDRQFVDDAEATIAKEKARPKDKIEGVKQDEAEFRDVVEEYRSAGRVTADDDNNLKRADELAGWAERRAKAFEAAAGCMETS